MEDIIRQFLNDFTHEYKKTLNSFDQPDNVITYKTLFELIQKHSQRFLILRKRHLLYLLQEALLTFWGPVESMDNFSAYGVSFVMYGTYGWIDEWQHRGMQEDSEVIAQVLSAGQNKTS